MQDNSINSNDDLIIGFLDDSEQMLNEVSNLFIEIEGGHHSYEVIDRIFRNIHTIKGNASILSLDKIKQISHYMEDLMNLIRQGVIEINAEIVGVLFKGVDYLQKVIKNVRNGQPQIDDEANYQSFIMQITLVFDKARKSNPRALWANMRYDLEAFESKFSTDNKSLAEIWKRIAQTIILVSPFLENKKNKLINTINSEEKKEVIEVNPLVFIKNALSEEFEETLREELSQEIFLNLQSLKDKVTEESLQLVDEAIELYQTTVPIDGFTSFLGEMILEKMEEVVLKKRKSDFVKEKNNISGEDSQEISKNHKTMRIYESTIDHFLDLIGDMVLIGETYGHIQKHFADKFGLNKAVTNLKKNNEFFNDLSLALQKSVLEIRRVPIKTLLDRAPRIIRDVAASSQKKIRTEISGEDLLIDKSLLESMESPFMHLIRNSADHGIESLEIRKVNGKADEGVVKIAVTEDSEIMTIIISDDGAGINKDNILQKAIEKGILTQQTASQLSEENIFKILFQPGFSTAKEVTEISGRGVGMDVVKKSIEAIGGKIKIQSVLNEGTSFILEIPKTVCVNIMEGFLVESSGSRFVLPMINVGESLLISEEDIVGTLEEGECILHHDKVFPIRRLSRILGLNNQQTFTQGVGVTLDVGNEKIILFVDKVLGTQQVVIKDINGLPKQSELILGGAVLGDEQLAIVLNVDSLINMTSKEVIHEKSKG